MREQFEKLVLMVNLAFQGDNRNKKGASAMHPTIPANSPEIIIISGWNGPGVVSHTMEKYNIVEGKSIPLPELNFPRVESASCVYNNDILVVGGYDGVEGTNEIEVLMMNQHPLQWAMLNYKLPVKLSGHDVIVFEGKLYIIGGIYWTETSNAIYEIALTPPYTTKLLTKMTGPIIYHKAEIVDGKLFILGGTTTGYGKDAIDRVVVYGMNKKKFKPCPSLPQAVCRMATVIWGDKIIVVGGMDKNGKPSGDVIMYETKTGRSERLPSLIQKRSGCSAVIINDLIVVFGGWNEELGYLNSVESFTIGDNCWKKLRGMIEKRHLACAVVKPL